MFGKLEPKADELIFNISSQERNFCDSFIYEPINPEEEKLGNLYMLGEVKDVAEDSFFILNHIATLVKRNYYALTQKPPLAALEETLKKTNEEVRNLISQKKTDWLGKLHFIIGVLSQDTFYFTLCGNPRLFFARRGEITDVGEKITSLVREPTPQKIFKSVASGKVEKEDKIFMFTSDVFQAFSRDQLKAVVESPEPAKKIKELVASQKLIILSSGGILILSFGSKEEKEYLSSKIEETPLPSTRIPLPKISQPRYSKILIFFLTLKRISKLIYLIFRLLFKSLIYFFRKTLIFLEKLRKFLINNLRKIGLFQKIEAEIKKILLRSEVQKIKSFLKLFRQKLVLVPLLLILLALAVFGGIQYQKQQIKMAEWKKILELSQTKYKEGEIALIYGAQDKALKLFLEAESLIYQLEKSPYFKPERNKIKELLYAKLQKLIGLEIVEDPEILVTLGEFAIKFDPQEIAIEDNLIFASAPDSALFYKYELQKKSGEFSFAPIEDGGVSKIISIQEPKKLLIFFSPAENVFFYSPEEKKVSSQSEILSLPYDNATLQDLASYKNNIYFLDPEEGEIIKFNVLNEEGKISPGKIWLSRKTKKVAGAKSITADGNIWILDSQNNILKYSAGVFIKTLKTNLDFENPIKIFTSVSHSLIYILDPPKKRLTLMTKTGQPFKQYFSEKFNDLRDFWVSDDGKIIYLLNKNQVFLIKVEF